MANIIQNHPLRFSIAASSSVSWIYLRQFWHTLKEDGSKYRLKFMLDRKEITMTLNDIIRIFQLPQATNNNHERFVSTPKFSEMAPFFLNDLDYVELLWEGLHYALEHPSTLIPYPRFTKLISIFNSRKNKAGFGMKIPSWMITDEMKLMEHYHMYVAVFGVDVPTTQSQLIESTQGTHRITSAPRSPNPDTDKGESSALRKSIVIRLHTIQLSLAEQKNHDELEAKQNVQKVKEHLIAEEIENLVEGAENAENAEVEITASVQPVDVNKEEEESAEDDYKLKRRGKGKHVEESRCTPSPITIRSPRIHSTLVSSDTKKLKELTANDPPPSSSTP
ncbi:hypothetical protein Tco_0656812 [Tanacetum coccineum]|uniref:Uncharacterized protein n=1 Tax=Tanacetum coccineum TaxID=301880 RepID=A0ABQ4XAK0_9ASTR